MHNCAACGTFILFGGPSFDGQRFCNDRCLQGYQDSGAGLQQYIPQESVAQLATEMHRGDCPACGKSGPVDVFHGHQVWSFLIATQWRTVSKVCCRSCARKHQLYSAGLSAVAGWWGFPWGILMTPIQIGRNVFALLGGGQLQQPSAQLHGIARSILAAQIAENSQQMSLVDSNQSNLPPIAVLPPSNSDNPYRYH
jgi:hypothetical protein